jgi:hypothetical protein
MQVLTGRTSLEHCESQLDLATLPHSRCVPFGGDAFLVAEASNWPAIATNARRSGTPLVGNPQPVESKNLHLVVQKGRLFQQEHPQIPVLLDKGRYLVVELEPESVEAFSHGDEPCFTIEPLDRIQVAFQEHTRSIARRIPVASIQALVDGVSRSSLETSLNQLVSWSTRYSTSPAYFEAAAWARSQLETLGYATRLDNVAVGGSNSQNVIAERSGSSSETRDLLLVVAHLDSINHKDGPAAIAPGADDNGSGSAGLLEIARVLSTYQHQHDLRFILVGGEEQGLFGSKQYVDSLDPAERARIKAVLNMDMIGSLNTASPTVLLEGAPLSQATIDGLAEAAETYTGLTIQTSLNPYNSDHVPFIEANIPAVLTIEGADGANSNVHSASDTLEKVNYDLMLDILRMNVAFLAIAAG